MLDYTLTTLSFSVHVTVTLSYRTVPYRILT